MRLPRIDFHTGGLGCPICHKELPLPQNLDVTDRTCGCGVVAGLLSKTSVHAQWGIGQDIQPRDGYRVILPYRNTIGLKNYVIFEQPEAMMTLRHSRPHDTKGFREEGRRVRDGLARENRNWGRRSMGA